VVTWIWPSCSMLRSNALGLDRSAPCAVVATSTQHGASNAVSRSVDLKRVSRTSEFAAARGVVARLAFGRSREPQSPASIRGGTIRVASSNGLSLPQRRRWVRVTLVPRFTKLARLLPLTARVRLPILSAVRRSLRTKVVIVVLVTTFIALSVATALMLTNEVDYYRNFLLADATTQADLLARVSAPALQFDDPNAAATNLELLNNRPSIRAAALYTPDGTIFATFSRPDTPAFPALGPPGVQISGGTLTMFQPIVQNEERLGTVYLESVYDLR